jgi:hypothetical protein
MPHELTAEQLDFFTGLVQRGFIEEGVDGAGEPGYRIASRFLDAGPGPGDHPEARVDQSAFGGSSA